MCSRPTRAPTTPSPRRSWAASPCFRSVRREGGPYTVERPPCGTRSFARRSNGSVWGWGNNEGGLLGDGTQVDQPAPVQILGN
ncbi:hypothetical protein ACLESD_42100 [Pyxidicoccus sp. 3LFB2]